MRYHWTDKVTAPEPEFCLVSLWHTHRIIELLHFFHCFLFINCEFTFTNLSQAEMEMEILLLRIQHFVLLIWFMGSPKYMICYQNKDVPTTRIKMGTEHFVHGQKVLSVKILYGQKWTKMFCPWNNFSSRDKKITYLDGISRQFSTMKMWTNFFVT